VILLPAITRHGTFNFLLSNGQALWAHASTNLHYLVRQHPFPEVHLRDEDVKVDLAELNGPEDRLAIVVTEPLTTNEQWTRIAPGELVTFVDGSPAGASRVPLAAPLALAG
jgi:glutamine amidotransferase